MMSRPAKRAHGGSNLNLLVLFSIVTDAMPPSIRLYENREELLESLTEPGHYPLEVGDDSMAAAGIDRGDTVVVQSQREPVCHAGGRLPVSGRAPGRTSIRRR